MIRYVVLVRVEDPPRKRHRVDSEFVDAHQTAVDRMMQLTKEGKQACIETLHERQGLPRTYDLVP